MFDFACEDPPLPDPPSPEMKKITIDISGIERELSSTLLSDHAAYHLSSAMHFLQERAMKRSGPRLPARQKDCLLSALAEVHSTFLTLFPEHNDQRMALKAFDAAVSLIVFWSQSDAERAKSDRCPSYEAHLSIRWLRNACHNSDIVQQIDERAVKQLAKAFRGKPESRDSHRALFVIHPVWEDGSCQHHCDQRFVRGFRVSLKKG